MSQPFFRGFDRYDLWTAALLAECLEKGSLSRARLVLEAIQPGEVWLNEANGVDPAYILSITPDYVFIAVQGTTGWAQWVLNVLGSVQVAIADIPGSVALSFGALASAFWPSIRTRIAGRMPGRKCVLIGHSLGAAAVQCMVSLANDLGPDDLNCFCLGAPRVGNPVFAAQVGAAIMRVETTSDPIVGVPPELWAGHDSRFPIPGVPPFAVYTQAGAVKTIDYTGQLADGGNGVTFADVVSAFEAWDAPTHPAGVYVSRLQVGLQLDPFPSEVGYADGQSLVAVDSSLNSTPAIRRMVSMPYLTEGTMFFRANNGVTEGWAESVFFSSDVPSVLSLITNTLIPARTAFLSNQVECHAIRAARADGVRFSLARKLQTVVPGQVALAVNEFGDCINFAVDSADGQRHIFNFRGIADDWTDGNKITALGNGAIPVMKAYLNTLIANGAALKIPFGGNPWLPIVLIANNPLAGGPIQVTTVTPSGVTQNTLVTVRGLRGFPYLRGNWRAQSVDALNFKLVGSQRYNIDLAVNTGEVRVDEFVASSMATYALSGVSFRKTGRPFGALRGKQSARIIRK